MKLSTWFKHRPHRPCLGYYGKLPIYPDFLEHGYGTGVEQMHRRWIEKAVARVGCGSGEDVAVASRGWMLRFMVSEPGGARAAVGLMWDSADLGGERRFPFSLHAVLSTDPAKVWWEWLPCQAEWMWDRLDQVRWDLLEARTPDDVARVCRQASFSTFPGRDDARRRNSGVLKSLTLGTIRSHLFGDAAMSGWPHLWWRLSRSFKEDDRPGAVVLPRLPTMNVAAQISFWSGAMAALSGGSLPVPAVFMPVGSCDRIFFFFRSLTSLDGHVLIQGRPAVLDDGLVLLREEGMDLGNAYQQFAATLLERQEETDGALAYWQPGLWNTFHHEEIEK